MLDQVVHQVCLTLYTLLWLLIQWNLRIKDTLGPAIVSSVERLSSSYTLKMNYYYGKGVQNCVLCLEVASISEGPLSEVPL